MTIEEIETKLKNGKISESFARNEAQKLGYTVRVTVEEFPDKTRHSIYGFVKYREIPKAKENIYSLDGKSINFLKEKKYYCQRCGKESNVKESGTCNPPEHHGRPYNKHIWLEK